MNAIYCFRDRNREIRYIGETARPLAIRTYEHLKEARGKKRTHKLNWLRSLDRPPIVEIMEWVPPEKAEERERYWIAWARSMGCNLVNATNGGEGVLEPSLETLHKIRTVLRRNNTSGVVGVHLNKNTGKYSAYLRRGKRPSCLGTFLTLEEATQAREAALLGAPVVRPRRVDNTSGVPGVYYCTPRKLWIAQIARGPKVKSLGAFTKFEDAVAARQQAEKILKEGTGGL